jgi:hypothetical protein
MGDNATRVSINEKATFTLAPLSGVFGRPRLFHWKNTLCIMPGARIGTCNPPHAPNSATALILNARQN